MHFSFGSKKTYTMNTTAASETLQNIFQACEKESVPLSLNHILMKQKPRTGIYTIGKWISIVMLLLTFLSPLAFSPSPVTLHQPGGAIQEFVLESHYVMNGNLYLQFYGDEIDPDESYMITDSGARFTCSGFNSEKNTISFLFDNEGANIYIVSKNGNTLHLLMSMRNG